MAELKTMYPAQPNTPETTLAGALTTSDTSVTVLDGSILPDAPNILTIGADTTTAETVLMTAKAGNVLTIERGYDGTTPRSWTKGDIIGRYFTAADQTAVQENIKALDTGKPDIVPSPVSGNFVAFDGTTGAQKDSGKKPEDFAPASHSHTGYIEKPASPVSGNFPAFDGTTGAVKDSGKKPEDFAPASHSHTGYIEKPASPVSGNFPAFDGTTGAVKDSGKKPEDFAPASHSHTGYIEKPASPVSGNFVAFDGTTGAVKDSGKKAADFAAASHSHTGYAEVKIFQNVTVAASAWANRSTYAGYPFAAVISCAGVTANHVPEVTFGVTEATGGNFAPVALSGAGTVTIYAAEKPGGAITLPVIKCEKAV